MILARFSEFVVDAARNVASPGRWQESRGLLRKESLVAAELMKLVHMSDRDGVDRELDNLWHAYGSQAFEAAMSRTHWVMEKDAPTNLVGEILGKKEIGLPGHVALLMPSETWRPKLCAMVPAAHWSDRCPASKSLTGRLVAHALGRIDQAMPSEVATVGAVEALCAGKGISTMEGYLSAMEMLKQAGCPAPQGAELVLCQRVLDGRSFEGRKPMLRVWSEAEQIKSVAAEPAVGLRKTRSL